MRLELATEGSRALIGREQTTSEGNISMKLRHTYMGDNKGGLGSGQGDFVLGGGDIRKSNWRMRLGLGLKTWQGENGLYPVNIPGGWEWSFKLKGGGRDSRADGGAETCDHFRN